MKIIYHCYGGAHSSVTAASIHLGWLTETKKPSLNDLYNLPYFDQQINQDHGQLRLLGNDQFDNQIYIIGRQSFKKILENLYLGLAELFDIPKDEIILVNVMPYVNWRMVVGGTLSRRFGLIKLGRPIVAQGTREAFLDLVSLVQKVKMLSAANSIKR